MRLWPRKTPVVDLTNDAYARWLRAQRPPLTWFLARTEDEQEAMAAMGDQHLQDLCIGIGYAVRDPQAAESAVGMAAGSQDAEVSLVQQLAAKVIAKMVQPQQSAPPQPPQANGHYIPPKMRPTGRKPEGVTP